MKKRFMALLLGGLMAIGGLSAMANPMVVYADDNYCVDSSKHFSLCTATAGDGKITILWVSDVATTPLGYGPENNDVTFFVSSVEIEDCETKDPANVGGESDDSGFAWETLQEVYPMKSGNYTFTGLTNGKTYYIYVSVNPKVDANGNELIGWWPDSVGSEGGMHNFMFVGACTPAAGLPDPLPTQTDNTTTPPAVNPPAVNDNNAGANPYESFEANLISQIKESQSGSTIVLDQGITTLSNSVMKELLEKKDVSLQLEFTYEDKDYVILIPAGKALDNDIPWYGPLYLALHFGNSAGTEGNYIIQAGDTMSKIAAANNMTLKQLLAKNPEIKDANKIVAGKTLNL